SCCTLDPGTWSSVATVVEWATSADGRKLAATQLRVQATVRRLVIDRSITGPIVVGDDGHVERLIVRETIVQAAATPPVDALVLTRGEAALSRCTVLGTMRVHRLGASECILHDVATVEDSQHGCLRFSAWATGSVVPRQYESVPIEPRAALFGALAFGRPDSPQLLDTATGAITRGAE